jgi:hypothetical protein
MKKLLVVLAVLFISFNLYAEKQEFEFEKINITYRKVSGEESDVVGFDKGKLRQVGKTQEWGMIQTVYNSLPMWADNVEVKYYVLMKGDSPKKPVMLTGSVVYIDVQKQKGHISTMYVPPQAIIRFGEVMRIRAEVWYNGVLQDSTEWPRGAKKSQWWTKVKPTYGSLFNRFYTPFEHEMQSLEELIKVE